jgi:hypothetical protein
VSRQLIFNRLVFSCKCYCKESRAHSFWQGDDIFGKILSSTGGTEKYWEYVLISSEYSHPNATVKRPLSTRQLTLPVVDSYSMKHIHFQSAKKQPPKTKLTGSRPALPNMKLSFITSQGERYIHVNHILFLFLFLEERKKWSCRGMRSVIHDRFIFNPYPNTYNPVKVGKCKKRMHIWVGEKGGTE